MSEFNPQAAPVPPPPAYTPPSRPAQSWLKRPVIFGQSAPWLALYAVVIIGAGWYLFAPDSKPNVNRLAFSNQDLQPAPQTNSLSFAPVTSPVSSGTQGSSTDSGDLAKMQDQVATMIGGLRSRSEVDRQAIEQLAQKVNALSDSQTQLKQQVSELQAQNALLPARGVVAQAHPGNRAAASTLPKMDRTPASAPLAGMHLSAVQNGMAWVLWQDKTWAVQVGDTLGPVTVTGIDAQSRQVRTSAGTLQ